MGKPTILAARMELVVAALIAALLIVGLLLADAGGRGSHGRPEGSSPWAQAAAPVAEAGDLRSEP
jgi:hypothetical protein